MNKNEKLLDQVQTILPASDNQKAKAAQIAEAIRLSQNYRWVGIYEVEKEEIAVIAWTGPAAPAYSRFPVTKGLNGEAVSTHHTVISNDVENDPQYLTAFGTTRSEMIVPVISPMTGGVIGTIDVESDRKNAFTDFDRERLQECSGKLALLWE